MQNDLISKNALRDDFIKNCRMECSICPDRDQESGECNLVCCAPVVDAVEVVRCKDCEHQHTVHCPMVYEDLDYTGTFVIVRDNSFNDDGFCHRGTPKKGETSK